MLLRLLSMLSLLTSTTLTVTTTTTLSTMMTNTTVGGVVRLTPTHRLLIDTGRLPKFVGLLHDKHAASVVHEVLLFHIRVFFPLRDILEGFRAR